MLKEIKIDYLLPPNLKLEWQPQFDFFVAHAINGAISIVVKKSQDKDNWGKWEIVIGVWYFSRDRNKYFENPGSAMLQAEIVLKAVAKKLGEIL